MSFVRAVIQGMARLLDVTPESQDSRFYAPDAQLARVAATVHRVRAQFECAD
jgi:hypothetical protein